MLQERIQNEGIGNDDDGEALARRADRRWHDRPGRPSGDRVDGGPCLTTKRREPDGGPRGHARRAAAARAARGGRARVGRAGSGERRARRPLRGRAGRRRSSSTVTRSDTLVVRVRPDAWRRAAEVAQGRSSTATTSPSSSGIDWAARAAGRATRAAATRRRRCSRPRRRSARPAPPGGSRCSRTCSRPSPLGRHAQGRRRRAPTRASSHGCPCTRAPTGTSASAGRCTASCFDGHPSLRHLYLPSGVRGASAAQGLPAARPRREAVARPRRRRGDARGARAERRGGGRRRRAGRGEVRVERAVT